MAFMDFMEKQAKKEEEMIQNDSVEFYVDDQSFFRRRRYSIHAKASGLKGEEFFMEPAKWMHLSDERVHTPPAIELTQGEMQNLFEQLWKLGFRPTTNVEHIGELRATKEHLKNMQMLVSKYAEVDLF